MLPLELKVASVFAWMMRRGPVATITIAAQDWLYIAKIIDLTPGTRCQYSPDQNHPCAKLVQHRSIHEVLIIIEFFVLRYGGLRSGSWKL